MISQDNVHFLRAVEANSYFSCPSSLSDLATLRILSDDAWVEPFIQTNRQRLAENYTITIRFLESHQIPYKKGGNVGFFVWVDFPIIYLSSSKIKQFGQIFSVKIEKLASCTTYCKYV